MQNRSSIITSGAIAISLMITSIGLAAGSASALSMGTPQKMPLYAASDNNLYVVWVDNNPDSQGEILFSKSTDGGVSFTNPTKVLDSKNVNLPIRLAASGDNVYLVWNTWTDRPEDVFLMKSEDAGDTFDSPINLSSDLPSSRSAQIAVYDDKVYVIWVSEASIFGNGILLRASTDGGETFGATTALASFSKMYYSQPEITAFQNNVYAAWVDLSNEQYDIVFAASNDNGKNFNKMNIDDPSTHGWGPDIDATENAAYVTYYEWLGEDPDWPTNGRVMLKRIVDYKILDTSVQVSREDGDSLGLFAEVPRVVAAASPMANDTDSVYVVWRDAVSNMTLVSARVSNDSGKIFGKIITPSNITWPYPIAAVAPYSFDKEGGKNILYVAWGNSIEYGKWDVFVAAIDENKDAFQTIKVSDSGRASDPQLFTNGNSSAYIFWTDGKYDEEYGDIFFSKVDVAEDGGKKLNPSPIIQISKEGSIQPSYTTNQEPSKEQLEECRELGIDSDKCTDIEILKQECLGPSCNVQSQPPIVFDARLISLFIGLGAAAVAGIWFLSKTRKLNRHRM